MEKVLNNNVNDILRLDEISNKQFYWIDFSAYDFSWKKFNDCAFEKCNLSNIAVKNTSFNNISFVNSKIMWCKFVDLNHFLSNFNFKDCNISLSSFYWLNLKNVYFEDSEIKETDFTNANLEGSKILYSDLEKSIFLNTNLKKTDLTGTYNFSINPNLNKLEKTKFSREYSIWLLQYFDIILD
jgi:uncharacterized protein YjbI with pentapeptide repeats